MNDSAPLLPPAETKPNRHTRILLLSAGIVALGGLYGAYYHLTRNDERAFHSAVSVPTSTAHVAEETPAAPPSQIVDSAPPEKSAPEKLKQEEAARKAEMALLRAEMESHARDIARLKRGEREAWNRVAQIDALAALVLPVQSGRPYAMELSRVLALTENNPALHEALSPLTAGAALGLPRDAALMREFSAAAKNALAPRAPEGAGFWQRLRVKISGLVVVRRVGEIPGDGAEARIARAENALSRQELAAAYDEISALSGPERDAFSAWLAHAGARLRADEALLAARRALSPELSTGEER